MIKEDIELFLRPTIEASGCDLWGIDFIHGANTPILRVFIDAVGGATIEDCEKISKDLKSLSNPLLNKSNKSLEGESQDKSDKELSDSED